MPPFLVSIPLILAVVLVASGVGKLLHPDDLDGWRALGVPASLRRQWLLRLHPWAEIALAAALTLMGGALGALAAAAAVALMGSYTMLVTRALQSANDASCACFGTRAAVTTSTLTRNSWLTGLATVALLVIWTTPLLGGPLGVLIASGQVTWLIPIAVGAVTTLLVLRSEQGQPMAASPPSAPLSATTDPSEGVAAAADEEDYVRTRTPAVPVTAADGSTVNLRTLAARKPVLLLAVSESCAACVPIIGDVAQYRALLPEVEVRLLIRALPEHTSLTDTAEPQTLHDPHGYVSGSIMDWPTPTAVLLGMDGMLAGGPEIGTVDIPHFIDDIYESLHGVRPEQGATVYYS